MHETKAALFCCPSADARCKVIPTRYKERNANAIANELVYFVIAAHRVGAVVAGVVLTAASDGGSTKFTDH